MKTINTSEQAKAIIRPEWNKMQDFLNEKHKQLNSVKVLFNNPQYNYSTSVSANTTEASAKEYFVKKQFNVGAYPAEIMRTCIAIEFTDNN